MNTPKDVRQELLLSNERILHHNNYKKLREALLSLTTSLDNVLILDWTPEQAEDIYWVMITKNHIAIIEIPRSASNASGVITHMISHSEYSQKFRSKLHQRKLKIATELLSKPGVDKP